jgi:hypothetical protein
MDNTQLPPVPHRIKALAQWLAHCAQARQNCIASNNATWQQRHADRIRALNKFLPSGSGFDNGSYLDQDISSDACLKLCTSFHHMDESGSYDGWTDHAIFVKPAFEGLHVASISGRDRNAIKEHIAETMLQCLATMIMENVDGTFEEYREATK